MGDDDVGEFKFREDIRDYFLSVGIKTIDRLIEQQNLRLMANTVAGDTSRFTPPDSLKVTRSSKPVNPK